MHFSDLVTVDDGVSFIRYTFLRMYIYIGTGEQDNGGIDLKNVQGMVLMMMVFLPL